VDSKAKRPLWAPWRIDYILSEKSESCFFCDYWGAPESDADNLVVHRAKESFVLLNRFPYNGGHLLVAPRDHVGRIEDLAPAVLCQVMSLVQLSEKVLRKTLKPEGFNVGMNVGKAAGAGVDDHLHMHIVPRWVGDTNFMPVLGDTRVMPEALEALRAKLVPYFLELTEE